MLIRQVITQWGKCKSSIFYFTAHRLNHEEQPSSCTPNSSLFVEKLARQENVMQHKTNQNHNHTMGSFIQDIAPVIEISIKANKTKLEVTSCFQHNIIINSEPDNCAVCSVTWHAGLLPCALSGHIKQERQGRLQVKLSCLSEHVRSEYTSLSVTKVHFSKCNNFKAVGIG